MNHNAIAAILIFIALYWYVLKHKSKQTSNYRANKAKQPSDDSFYKSAMADAKVEKFCPNCGGPVSFDSDRCAHCGSFLPGIAMHKKLFDLKEKEIRANDENFVAEKELELNHQLELKKLQFEKEKRREWLHKIIFIAIGFIVLFIAFKFGL